MRITNRTAFYSDARYVTVLLLLNVVCHQATYGSEINCVNYLSDITLSSFHGGEFKHNYKGIIMVIKYINCHFRINVSYRHS